MFTRPSHDDSKDYDLCFIILIGQVSYVFTSLATIRFISLLISHFFSILPCIVWPFQHPIILEIFWMVISGLLETTQQLHRSIGYLWTLWCAQPSRTYAFDTPWSHPSLCAPKLPHFRCTQAMIFPAWIFL